MTQMEVSLLLTVVFPAKPVQWDVAILGNVYIFTCVLHRCTACVLRVGGVYSEVYLDHACKVTCTCVPGNHGLLCLVYMY